MKTTLLAAAAALSLGVGSAYADGGVPPANTMFTQFSGVLAQAPHAAAVALTSNEPVVQGYVTQSSHGTWLFEPNGNQGANS